MFDDLQTKLDTLHSVKARKKIMTLWTRLFAAQLKQTAKDLNPFLKSKAKPLFKVKKDKKKKGQVNIFGLHPNVAEDPNYTNLPKEGFYFGRMRLRVPINPRIKKFRTVFKTQEHKATLGKKVASGDKTLTAFFNYNKRIYGFYDYERGLYMPAYSTRSIPQIVAEYPQLENIMRESFKEAFEQYMREAGVV